MKLALKLVIICLTLLPGIALATEAKTNLYLVIYAAVAPGTTPRVTHVAQFSSRDNCKAAGDAIQWGWIQDGADNKLLSIAYVCVPTN